MKHTTKHKWTRHAALGLLGAVFLLAALYAINAWALDQYRPEATRIERHAEKTGAVERVRVVAFNVHRCDAIAEGGVFGYYPRTSGPIGETVDAIAAFLRAEDADIVFMSEICAESFLSHINQIEALAEQAGYAWAVFGHNANIGLPFPRHRTGNAILSKFPIVETEVVDLSEPGNPLRPQINRRVLRAVAEIGGQRYSLYSVHLAAHYPATRLRQAEALRGMLLADVNPIIMGGDFNDTPESEPLLAIRSVESIRTGEKFEVTYVRWPPERTIDYAFAPKSWQLIEYKRVTSDLSDHYPVVALFEMR